MLRECEHCLDHLSDAKRMALRELSVAPRWLPLRYPPLKQLIIYLAPFPKGAPTAPELLARQPEAWHVERRHLSALIQRFGTAPPEFVWPAHPAFGTLSRRAWGVLAYRHIDYHLRQFGV
jgi:hypothetical protein